MTRLAGDLAALKTAGVVYCVALTAAARELWLATLDWPELRLNAEARGRVLRTLEEACLCSAKAVRGRQFRPVADVYVVMDLPAELWGRHEKAISVLLRVSVTGAYPFEAPAVCLASPGVYLPMCAGGSSPAWLPNVPQLNKKWTPVTTIRQVIGHVQEHLAFCAHTHARAVQLMLMEPTMRLHVYRAAWRPCAA